MLVKEWMTEGSINLGQETSIAVAADIMRKNNVRQLPVIDDDGNLVGILSDRDTRDAMPSKFLPGDAALENGTSLLDLKVKEIMTPDPLSISPDVTVEVAAGMLQANKIGGLPVIDNGKLVGIITEVDVFNYLCSVTGVTRKGIQLVFKMSDDPGSAIELLSTLKDEDIRLNSVLSSYEKVDQGYRHVSIHLQSTGKHTLESLSAMLKDKFDLLYYVDNGKAVFVS